MPEQLACVSALVGAGGNAGAVFAGFAFYKQDWEPSMGQDATLTPFKLHALYVIVTALMNPAYSWSHLGSMWSDAWEVPSATEKEDVGSKSTVDTATAAPPATRRRRPATRRWWPIWGWRR